MKSCMKNLKNVDFLWALLLVSTYVVFCLKVCVSTVVSVMPHSKMLDDFPHLDDAD
jgi:hypothetical protein